MQLRKWFNTRSSVVLLVLGISLNVAYADDRGGKFRDYRDGHHDRHHHSGHRHHRFDAYQKREAHGYRRGHGHGHHKKRRHVVAGFPHSRRHHTISRRHDSARIFLSYELSRGFFN